MKKPAESDHLTETIIQSEGMYLAVFDRLSSVNTPNKWSEVWEMAKVSAGSDTQNHLFDFNDIWSGYNVSKELLTWVLSLDGVYRIRIVVLPHEIQLSGDTQNFIGSRSVSALLECPSGEIIVDNLYHLGRFDAVTIAVVPAGLYQVHLISNSKEQQKHELLVDIKSYPENDGPDWTIYMNKIN